MSGTTSLTLASSTRAHLARLADHLYRLGPRPIYEALGEVLAGADLLTTLEAYEILDPGIVKYLGADRLDRVRR